MIDLLRRFERPSWQFQNQDLVDLSLVGRHSLDCECFLSFLIYKLNEFFAEVLIATRDLEDLGIAFFSQSFFRKRRLHL
jgi:hypothetical protein